jgi:copper chaperone CopZ
LNSFDDELDIYYRRNNKMHTFYVPDMNCKHCVKRITESLNEAGFSDFEVDLEAKKVTAKVTDEAAKNILSILEEAGYSPVEATIE